MAMKDPRRRPSRRRTPVTKTSGSKIEDVARAAQRKRQQVSHDFSLMTATEPFHDFMSRLDDPFAVAYVAHISPSMQPGVQPSHEEASNLLRQLASDAAAHYELLQNSSMKELAEAVQDVDPLPLLCGMMALTKFQAWGTYFEPQSVPMDLDLELVVAIIVGSTNRNRKPATFIDLERTARLARRVRFLANAVATAHRYCGQSIEDATRGELLLRWLLRRGEAYFPHAIAISRALAYEGRDWFKKNGFDLDDILHLTGTLFRQWDADVTPAFEVAWRRACAATGENPRSVGKGSIRFVAVFYETIMYELPDALTIPLNDKVDPQCMDYTPRSIAAINSLSIRCRPASKAVSVLVEPPQRYRPFIILPNIIGQHGEVALAVNPAGLSTDLHLTIEAILSRSGERWPAKRARAIDRLIIDVLRRILPGCQAFSNVFMDGPEGREEIDGIVVYENIAIVIEGKGAPLKLAARRGSVDKLIAQLRELVGTGCRQLKRDADYVYSGSHVLFYDQAGRIVLTINGQQVRRCYQIMPCLDGLGEFGTSISKLSELQIIESSERPWIVGAAAFNLVADILDKPGEFIAYLEFRSRWCAEPRLMIMDEVEMLSLFIYQVDLAARLKSAPDTMITHPPTQAMYDAWYDGLRGAGPTVEKPRLVMTSRIRRFVDEMQRLRPTGWLESVIAVLQVPYSVAAIIDRNQKELAAEAAEEGVVLTLYADCGILVIADDVDSADLKSQCDLRSVESPAVLVLRQRGNALRIEDSWLM